MANALIARLLVSLDTGTLVGSARKYPCCEGGRGKKMQSCSHRGSVLLGGGLTSKWLMRSPRLLNTKSLDLR